MSHGSAIALSRSLPILALAACATAASGAEVPAGPHVVVTGTATVTAPADFALISFPMEARGTTPALATAALSGEVAVLLELVGSDPDAGTTISATDLSIDVWRGARRVDETEFNAARVVTVRMTKLDEAPAFIARVVEAGIGSFEITVGTTKEATLNREALVAAVADARQSAEESLAVLGAQVGRAYSVKAVGRHPRSGRLPGGLISATSDSNIAFELSAVEITHAVNVVFLVAQ